MADNPTDIAQYQSDHDILIEMRTEVRLLRQSIDKANDGTQTTLDDHEKRLRFIERWVWLALGGLAVIEFALNLLSNNGFHI